MLPQARRLSRRDVERLMKEGRPLTAGALRMRYVASTLSSSRFAFVVSKKVARDAVGRNRLRRWAAAAALELPAHPPIDAAVTLTRRFASLAEVREELSALIARCR